jgi:hypothetical protein
VRGDFDSLRSAVIDFPPSSLSLQSDLLDPNTIIVPGTMALCEFGALGPADPRDNNYGNHIMIILRVRRVLLRWWQPDGIARFFSK